MKHALQNSLPPFSTLRHIISLAVCIICQRPPKDHLLIYHAHDRFNVLTLVSRRFLYHSPCVHSLNESQASEEKTARAWTFVHDGHAGAAGIVSVPTSSLARFRPFFARHTPKHPGHHHKQTFRRDITAVLTFSASEIPSGCRPSVRSSASSLALSFRSSNAYDLCVCLLETSQPYPWQVLLYSVPGPVG